MFLEGYKRNWLHTEGYSFEDRMIDDLSVSGVLRRFFRVRYVVGRCRLSSSMCSQKAMEQEEGDEEEEKETKPDPLHQLILHFSRTALTEKRFDTSTVAPKCLTTRQPLIYCSPIRVSHFSKLDTDHLYMAYADIMAKVSHCWPLLGFVYETCTLKCSYVF